MMVLLSGLGLDAASQARMASVTSRVMAVSFGIANSIIFGYSLVVMLGLTSGRSDRETTRCLAVMSFASFMETLFWIVWPTNGYSLYASMPLDLLTIGVLIYKYRNPMEDWFRSRRSLMLIDDNEPTHIKARLAKGPRSSEMLESPRRSSHSPILTAQGSGDSPRGSAIGTIEVVGEIAPEVVEVSVEVAATESPALAPIASPSTQLPDPAVTVSA